MPKYIRFLTHLLIRTLLLSGGLVNAAEPVRGGTLIAVINPAPSVLSSTINNHFSVNAVSPNVFDGLLSYDKDMNPQLNLALS
ncbi:MAG: hypothetical protein ACSLEN_03925 [Candidatus Malihini olakiniferum]